MPTVTIPIPITQRGVPNGVATLDGIGKVPISQIPSSIIGGMIFQGNWDAATNTPTLTSGGGGNPGHYYYVTVAGTTLIDGISDWQIGDLIVDEGTYYFKIDNSEDWKVKASAGDASPAFLDTKVDGTTIEVLSDLLKVKDNIFVTKTTTETIDGVKTFLQNIGMTDDKVLWFDTGKTFGIKHNSTSGKIEIVGTIPFDFNNNILEDIQELKGTSANVLIKSTSGNVILRLGDNLGVQVLDIQDSSGVTIATIDSDGNISSTVFGNSEAVVTDASGNLSTVAKGTAFNKNFGAITGTVSEGDHTHAHSAITGQTTDDHHAKSHASEHATGQPDALAPGDIGAEVADLTIIKQADIDTLAELNAILTDVNLVNPTDTAAIIENAAKRARLSGGAGTMYWGNILDGQYVKRSGTNFIGISAGGIDSDAIHDNVSGEINAITAKGTLVDTDEIIIEDSAATYAKKKSLLSVLKTYVLNGLAHISLTGVTADQHHSQTHGAGHVDGTDKMHPIVSKVFGDSPYTALISDEVIICDASGGAIVVNLPTAVGNAEKVFTIKKIDSSANTVTIDGAGTETIDNSLTFIISSQYNTMTVISDGTGWWIY